MSSFGFQNTIAPLTHPLVINLQHIMDDGELLGRVFAIAEEVKQRSITELTAKINALELKWEQARVTGVQARDAFQAHKRDELTVQNDVQSANNKMMAKHRILSSYRNAELDPYASKQERAARENTIAECEIEARQAEKAAMVANGCQQAYYSEAQGKADAWNAAQRNFAEIDGQLKSLKQQLADIDAEN